VFLVRRAAGFLNFRPWPGFSLSTAAGMFASHLQRCLRLECDLESAHSSGTAVAQRPVSGPGPMA